MQDLDVSALLFLTRISDYRPDKILAGTGKISVAGKVRLRTTEMLRKQYHFRNIQGDLYAWDVHRLIRLSKTLHPTSVPLADIAELNENWWYKDPETIPTPRALAAHMALVNDADLAFPILLCAEGRLMDGMHRLVKALLQGQAEIQAIKFPVTPKADYINVPEDDLPYPDEVV